MTVQEAIKKHITECEERIFRIKDFLERSKDAHIDECKENILVLETAIQALEEVEQYRALGTVEELKEAREKQVAKKPNKHEEDILGEYYSCPNCMNNELDDIFDNYCPRCGQALEWGEENDDVYR